jgi:ribose transport system substrate-binding protein
MKHHRHLTAALAVAVLAAAGAGCGSSDGGSPSASAGTGDASGDASIAKYQSIVEKAMQGPTEWQGPTEPVTPPKNQKIALITCASVLQGCSDPAKAAAAAAKDLGWQATVYDGKGDPATQNRLITQAVNSGADAILTFSVDPSFIASGLKAAKAKGIPVGSSAQGVAPSPTGFAFDVGANWEQVGNLQGNWIVADSKGKADFQPMVDKEYASVVASVQEAINVVKSCGGCKVRGSEEFVGANVGNGLGQRVVGLLRRDPKIKYLLATYDPAAADVATAVANAGMASKVKVIGQIGLSQNFGLIRDSKGQAVDIAFDQQYTGYATVDQLIRQLAKKPLIKSTTTTDPRFIYGENVPIKLITKANAPAAGEQYTAPIDAVAHFRKLWGVSGS